MFPRFLWSIIRVYTAPTIQTIVALHMLQSILQGMRLCFVACLACFIVQVCFAYFVQTTMALSSPDWRVSLLLYERPKLLRCSTLDHRGASSLSRHSCVVPFRPCPSMFVVHRTWDLAWTSTGRFHTTRIAHRRPWKASHGAHRIGDRHRQHTGEQDAADVCDGLFAATCAWTWNAVGRMRSRRCKANCKKR